MSGKAFTSPSQIQIDAKRVDEQVAEITAKDFFQDLEARAALIRHLHRG